MIVAEMQEDDELSIEFEALKLQTENLITSFKEKILALKNLSPEIARLIG